MENIKYLITTYRSTIIVFVLVLCIELAIGSMAYFFFNSLRKYTALRKSNKQRSNPEMQGNYLPADEPDSFSYTDTRDLTQKQELKTEEIIFMVTEKTIVVHTNEII